MATVQPGITGILLSQSQIPFHLPSPGVRVAAILGQQLGVGPGFGDAASGHDVDAVGLHGGGEAVGDEKHRPSSRQAQEPLQPIAPQP